MRRELGRPQERQPLLRQLGGMRHRISPAAEDVVFRDVDDQPAFGWHHRQRGMFRRHDARGDRLPEDGVGSRQICLPEISVPFHQRVFSGDAVDDDIESLVGAGDAPEKRCDFGLDRVIDAIVSGRPYGDGSPLTLRPVQ
jgi:hypothetical protein